MTQQNKIILIILGILGITAITKGSGLTKALNFIKKRKGGYILKLTRIAGVFGQLDTDQLMILINKGKSRWAILLRKSRPKNG